MKHITCLTAALLFTVAGCGSSRTASTVPHDSPCTALVETRPFNLTAGGDSRIVQLNDRHIIGRLQGVATELIKDGKTVKAGELVEQLKRDKCRLDTAAPADTPLTPGEIHDKHRSAVLIVAGVYKCGKCDNWHGAPASGFVIDPAGVIVTNYHVIDHAGRETFVAMTDDGRIFPVKEVLAASKTNDIAIVKLDLPENTKLPALALAPDAPVGTPATVISHPDSRFFSLTHGLVSRYFGLSRDGAHNIPTMAITADYAKGSSGAPVFNPHGAVIGMVASTHSVYYNEENGKQDNLQMVFKQCVPAASIIALIEAAK